jgi:hypothetical protein
MIILEPTKPPVKPQQPQQPQQPQPQPSPSDSPPQNVSSSLQFFLEYTGHRPSCEILNKFIDGKRCSINACHFIGGDNNPLSKKTSVTDDLTDNQRKILQNNITNINMSLGVRNISISDPSFEITNLTLKIGFDTIDITQLIKNEKNGVVTLPSILIQNKFLKLHKVKKTLFNTIVKYELVSGSEKYKILFIQIAIRDQNNNFFDSEYDYSGYTLLIPVYLLKIDHKNIVKIKYNYSNFYLYRKKYSIIYLNLISAKCNEIIKPEYVEKKLITLNLYIL